MAKTHQLILWEDYTNFVAFFLYPTLGVRNVFTISGCITSTNSHQYVNATFYELRIAELKNLLFTYR